MKNYIIILLLVFSAVLGGSAADAAIIVGRISHTEGQIYRYMDVDESWVEVAQQSPAGTEDILLTGDDSRAEVTFPNNMVVRLDEDTEIEIKKLDEDAGGFLLHNGLARFYNLGAGNVLTVETVRGTLKVRPGTVVDMQIGGQAVTIASVDGAAAFYSYYNNEEKVDVISGTTSLTFRQDSTVASGSPFSLDWDRWCAEREGVWAGNRMARSEHLPEALQEYSYAMEPYGRWQRVYYRGYYYWAWSPYSIAVGWSPYTSGYWYDWHGSPVWIDDHPWGWVTHHYGYWMDLQGIWMWTPYVHVSHVPGVTVIGLDITFGKQFRPHWHPGRVRWISHYDYIGWLPLAPWETYYGSRKWGPRSVVVRDGINFSININLANQRYIDHAVIIPKRYLYDRRHGAGGRSDRAGIHNVRKDTLLKDYRPLLTAEGHHREHTAGPDPLNGNRPRRVVSRRKVSDVRERKFIPPGKNEREYGRSAVSDRRSVEEKNRLQIRENGGGRAERKEQVDPVTLKREKARQKNERNSIVRALGQQHEENVERNRKTPAESILSERDNRRNETGEKQIVTGRSRVNRLPEIETGRKTFAGRNNKTASARGNERLAQKGAPRVLSKGPDRGQTRTARSENVNKKKYESGEKLKKEKRVKVAEEDSNNTRNRAADSLRRESGQSGSRQANSSRDRRFR